MCNPFVYGEEAAGEAFCKFFPLSLFGESKTFVVDFYG